MHLLAFMLWRAPEHILHQQAQRRMEITWVLPPRPQSMPQSVARTPAAAPPQRSGRAWPAPAAQAAPQAIHATPAESAIAAEAPQAVQPQPITPPPLDPFALPQKSKGDVLQESLKSAGAIDRKLRNESWNPRDKHIVSAAVEEAEKGTRAGTTIETFELPDGRKMARVRLPNGGSYCAAMQSNALTGGRDPFRDGVKTQVSTCPR